jgi:hypothetical protein
MRKELFESKLMPVPECGCWLWTGATFSGGYGHILHEGKHCSAHRMAWEYYRGPIPEGLSVLHKCDTPPCCNPDHLFLGTQMNNVHDMHRKGRWEPTPLYGHENSMSKLTEDQAIDILWSKDASIVLSRLHGVSTATIKDIRSGRTWKHLDREIRL